MPSTDRVALIAEPDQEMIHLCGEQETPAVICRAQDRRRQGRKPGVAAYLVKATLPCTLLLTLHHISQGAQP